jgi:hypothetical protein
MSLELFCWEILLLFRYVACGLMLAFVCIEAYKRTRHLVRRLACTKRQRWPDQARLYGGVARGVVIGGPVLFTLFHIAEMNHLMS